MEGSVHKHGLVLNIQRFSVDDGPGIRSTVFLKGCSLQCFWCHNPESIYSGHEIQFFAHKCVSCGRCSEVCPAKAQSVGAGPRVFAREQCDRCGRCVEACGTGALVVSGKVMSVSEVMADVRKDAPFYENSGGGVTFSGGEPLLQTDFLVNLLAASKDMGLHTAVDTAGNVPWNAFMEVLPYSDLFLYDVKTADSAKHEAATGTGNRMILDNLKRLVDSGLEVWVRVPVIPGVNDTVAEVEQIANLVQSLGAVTLIELLPYHRLGEAKYQSLGVTYAHQHCSPPAEELMSRLAEVFRGKGLTVRVG